MKLTPQLPTTPPLFSRKIFINQDLAPDLKVKTLIPKGLTVKP